MDLWGAFVGGIVVGVLMTVAVLEINIVVLGDAQYKYTECLALGAPQQNCLEKFLLPKAQP